MNMIKDAGGQNCYVNDTVWMSTESGAFVKATICEIYQDYLLLMTQSNSMLEMPFKAKNNTPSCNTILRGTR